MCSRAESHLFCKMIVEEKLVSADNPLTASDIMNIGGIAGSLNPFEPIMMVSGIIFMASLIAFTH